MSVPNVLELYIIGICDAVDESKLYLQLIDQPLYLLAPLVAVLADVCGVLLILQVVQNPLDVPELLVQIRDLKLYRILHFWSEK